MVRYKKQHQFLAQKLMRLFRNNLDLNLPGPKLPNGKMAVPELPVVAVEMRAAAPVKLGDVIPDEPIEAWSDVTRRPPIWVLDEAEVIIGPRAPVPKEFVFWGCVGCC